MGLVKDMLGIQKAYHCLGARSGEASTVIDERLDCSKFAEYNADLDEYLALHSMYQSIYHYYKRFERLAKLCESPVEAAFWSTAYFELSKFGRLTPQVKVGPYRLDFGLETSTFKLAIEIDGHDYHSTKEQKATDYQRDRYLQSQGWRVIRFSGSEVYQDASKCALEAVKIARGIK
jgi:very-short-patch-repair endonuclease